MNNLLTVMFFSVYKIISVEMMRFLFFRAFRFLSASGSKNQQTKKYCTYSSRELLYSSFYFSPGVIIGR
jgi:hypothetical protein